MPNSTVSFRITLSNLEWLVQNIQWHEASRGLSATSVTVMQYCIDGCHLLIAHCSSHRSIASYSSWIAIFAYLTCIQHNGPLYGSQSEYYRNVWYRKKTDWWFYQMVKSFRISLPVSTEYTNATDKQTPHDGIGRTYVWHRAAKTNYKSSC